MGLSSNIVWHQAPLDSIIEILKAKSFICSYSVETIKWRRSSLEVAFPMVSFCNLPISDMKEYLTDNRSNDLTGKYGECTIGLSYEWAYASRMSNVWYLDPICDFLREILPSKNSLLKSLKSHKYHNRWLLLSRIKPFTGSLESKGFINYRFYDEKEVRYVPSPKHFDSKTQKVLTKDEYIQYKTRRRMLTGKNKGDGLIPDLLLPFTLNDIRYILCVSDKQIDRIQELVKVEKQDIIFMTYSRVVEDIIGMSHFIKKTNDYSV